MSLFSDSFCVLSIDPEGKRFDRVSRAICESSGSPKCQLTLDYHCQLFPLKLQDKFTMDIVFEEECDTARLQNSDYAMNGMIFKIEQNSDMISTFISFGGLLALIKSDSSKQQYAATGKKISATFKKIV